MPSISSWSNTDPTEEISYRYRKARQEFCGTCRPLALAGLGQEGDGSYGRIPRWIEDRDSARPRASRDAMLQPRRTLGVRISRGTRRFRQRVAQHHVATRCKLVWRRACREGRAPARWRSVPWRNRAIPCRKTPARCERVCTSMTRRTHVRCHGGRPSPLIRASRGSGGTPDGPALRGRRDWCGAVPAGTYSKAHQIGTASPSIAVSRIGPK